MYIQILVDPNQRDLQRIMWKTRADALVKTYKLATVTYGTVSAPFLATRTLTLQERVQKKKLQTRLSQLLLRGGFELHKWVSNSPELLKDLSASSYVFDKEFQDTPVKKIATTRCNGRVEELLPNLSKVNNFKIPRCIQLPATIRFEIHGFSDASERSYAVVVYIKCFNESGQSQTRLLCSKSRVALLKTLTIPRFINNIKAKESRNKEKYLTADEIKRSTEFLAKIAQLSEFKAEIDALKKGKDVSKTSKLKALDHFLDENSLLRVGGRLSNADLPFEAKHQIIIPKAMTYLTTEAFIAALKRLCARRGRISTLMSDIATNFKGAAAELNRVIKLICNKNETLSNYFASEAIQWKFIPPRSPNVGGLWKARQRNKWQLEKNNVAVGCLVLLKENDLPPCKWAMARILEVIYGTDDISCSCFSIGELKLPLIRRS
ncbi:integrase catalytic domain-containing protein [Trichonephila clavipes]|nr:integrase catalytic domain-containing protein [Trichonephila clavipes]